jgi:hypothetical protein
VVDASAQKLTRTLRSNRRGAVQLLKRLREGTLDVSEISTHERRVCVAYLRLEGYTQEEAAPGARSPRSSASTATRSRVTRKPTVPRWRASSTSSTCGRSPAG